MAVPGGIEPPFAGWKPAVLTDRRRDRWRIFYFKSWYNSRLIKLHNDSKCAKFTKGRSWKLAYYETYKTKSIALKQEYKLKKDYNLITLDK